MKDDGGEAPTGDGRVPTKRGSPRFCLELYPVAIPMLLVAELFVISGASPFAATRSLASAFVVGLMVAAAARVATRDRHIGALLAAFALLLPIALGIPATALLAALVILLLLVVAWLPVAHRPAIRWAVVDTAVRRTVMVIALAIAIQTVQSDAPADTIRALERESPWRASLATSAIASADAPDIFLLLLDGYARSDILRDTYGWDQGPFLNSMRARGFVDSPASHANYPDTSLSLVSMLEMRHLNDIGSMDLRVTAGEPTGSVVRRALSDASGFRRLRHHGYEIVGVSPGYEHLSLREADRFIDTGQLNEFEVQVLVLSGWSRIVGLVAPDAVPGQWRGRVKSSFDAVAEIAETAHGRPLFVVGHIPSPHAPWVLRSDGTGRSVPVTADMFQDPTALDGYSATELEAGYVEQVAYVETATLRTVDRILKAASRPAVVIVFSDHGPAHPITTLGVEARLRNLFLARTPGFDRLFAPDITLVNVLPTLLNAYASEGLAPLPDTLFTWRTPDDRSVRRLQQVSP